MGGAPARWRRRGRGRRAGGAGRHRPPPPHRRRGACRAARAGAAAARDLRAGPGPGSTGTRTSAFRRRVWPGMLAGTTVSACPTRCLLPHELTVFDLDPGHRGRVRGPVQELRFEVVPLVDDVEEVDCFAIRARARDFPFTDERTLLLGCDSGQRHCYRGAQDDRDTHACTLRVGKDYARKATGPRPRA
jgi:hypothetical protein